MQKMNHKACFNIWPCFQKECQHGIFKLILIWHTVPSYGSMMHNCPHVPITWSNPWLDNVIPCKRCSYLTFGNFPAIKTLYKNYTNDATSSSSFLRNPWLGPLFFFTDLNVRRKEEWISRMIYKRVNISSSYAEIKLICCWWQYSLNSSVPQTLTYIEFHTMRIIYLLPRSMYICHIFWSHATLLKCT